MPKLENLHFHFHVTKYLKYIIILVSRQMWWKICSAGFFRGPFWFLPLQELKMAVKFLAKEYGLSDVSEVPVSEVPVTTCKWSTCDYL